jgi:hypothetical protein
MKLFTAVLAAAIAGSTNAFAPSTTAFTSTSLKMADVAVEEEAPAVVEEVAEEPEYVCISREEVLKSPNCIEFVNVWDPLGLSTMGSDETVAWFRHAEVKHGRVAMAAFVGWWAVAAGARLPGQLSSGLDFASLPSKGLAAWDATPGWGKAQMLLFAGLIELHDELFYSRPGYRGDGKHYLRGGVPGQNMVPGLFDPLGFNSKRSEEEKARGRDVEIKNGRLAMIGIMGLYAAASIEGSVPLLTDC